ncbi:MAG TPA: 2-dehydropantoate 2-reductase [Candidatus Didemnitutus sp.]|nr:2-dehydropantoate 2-reductase [Candidatus Didemnitutus sp.]
MARIALVGPGAIGGAIAAWLAHTGRHEVILCARRPLEGELHVETPSGPLVARPHVLTDPKQATPVDWVLVATKAYDAAGAAAWLPGLAANGAPVAILQNGVEHRERFAPFFPVQRIVPVMIDLPAERVSPTHIRQRGTGKMVVTDDARGRVFAGLFAGTPLEVSLTADLKSAVWRKLCLNAAGVISGIVMQPAGVMRDEAIADLARQIVRECIAVGRAEGAKLDDSLVEWVIQSYRDAPADSVNSLHGDRIAGRVTEIDARNGVIVRLGRKHGIAAPCNQMAVALIEALTKPKA